jgi:hypothetical protein
MDGRLTIVLSNVTDNPGGIKGTLALSTSAIAPVAHAQP